MFNAIKTLFTKSKIPCSTIDYDFYFETSEYDSVNLSVLNLGNLRVPTGNIVVSDPLVCLGEAQPFNKHVNPGEYPVLVFEAKTPDMGDRFAFAKLVIKSTRAIKWELAITKDEEKKIAQFKNDEYIGFPVDTGLGSFCDNVTQQQYKAFCESFLKNHPNAAMYDNFFAAEFKKNAKTPDDPQDLGNWLNFTIPNTENNVVMFSSGFGDGLYPAYWGIDDMGEICSLVIDFRLFG